MLFRLLEILQMSHKWKASLVDIYSILGFSNFLEQTPVTYSRAAVYHKHRYTKQIYPSHDGKMSDTSVLPMGGPGWLASGNFSHFDQTSGFSVKNLMKTMPLGISLKANK